MSPERFPANESRREAWLKTVLKQVPAKSRLIDAGAGQLRYKKFCDHLEYVSQDFGEYRPDGDGSGLQQKEWDQSEIDILSDITAIPEPDGSFDAVLCVEVLEHLPDPVAALREFARLLRVGGVLILTAPFCSLTHYAPYHFSTGFSRYWYEKWLPALDFEIAELCPNGNFFDYLAQELRRIPKMAERYACSNRQNPLKRRFQDLARRSLLSWLAELSGHDTGSSELLAFGFHVRAVRKDP